MGARQLAARAAAVVAVTVLCGFSAVHAAADEDSTSAPEATEAPEVVASSDPDANTVAKKGAASQLSIGTGPGDRFPFGSAGGDAGSSDEVFFEGGGSLGRFSCLGEQEALAVEQPNVGVRRLGIWVASEAAGILEGLIGSSAEQPGVWVTDGQVKVFSEDGKTEGSPVLLAALDSPLPAGTKIQAGEEQNRNTALALQYDCRQEGKAIVELRLRAESSDSSKGDVCLRWVKKCTTGWSSLTIEQDESAVVTEGQIQADWVQRMTNEGTNRQAIKFVLQAEGIERIRRPTVSSDQKLVSVDLLGQMAWNEKSEVSTDTIDLTVSFSCIFDGHAVITVVLEKDTFSGDEPERLEFSFKKVCGTEAYQHLDVFVKSEKYKNRTMAYSQGAVVPGFGRPCKGFESEALLRPGMLQDQGQGCQKGTPVLIVSEEELRTVLELEVDKLGTNEPPKFEPQPDITYNHKVLRVQVLQSPSVTPLGNRKSGKGNRATNKRQVLSLKYTCFKDEETTIMVTLHVLAHNSIHLAWTKRCVEPKAKAGKAFTAPQAILVTMFCIGVIVVLGLVFFFYCGNSEETEDFGLPTKPHKKAYTKVDVADESGGSNLGSKAIGNEEVVYHS